MLDSYEALPEKIICSIDFILSHYPHVKYAMKIDDNDVMDRIYDLSLLLDDFHAFIPPNATDYFGGRLFQPQERFAWGGNGTAHHKRRVSRNSPWRTRSYSGEFVPWLGFFCCCYLICVVQSLFSMIICGRWRTVLLAFASCHGCSHIGLSMLALLDIDIARKRNI